MRGTPTHYFKSLNRPMLLLGIEQRLLFLILALCVPVAMSSHYKPVMDLIAALLFSVLYAIGLLLARIDPLILNLYLRHMRYHNYYAPVAGIHAKSLLAKPSVPFYEGKRGLV